MIDDTPAERSFRYRRWYTYLAGLTYGGLIAIVILKVGDAGPLKWIALALIAANVIREGFYMGGASLSDWAQLTRAWRGTKPTE